MNGMFVSSRNCSNSPTLKHFRSAASAVSFADLTPIGYKRSSRLLLGGPWRAKSSRRCVDTAETARQSASGTKRSITDIMRLVNQGSTVEDGNDDAKKLRIESPIKTLSPNATRHNISTSSVPSSGSQNVKNNDDVALNSSTTAQKLQTNGARYFSVLWCKLSSKKHKKWEGDAVLIVKGRSAQLKSLEGKELGSTFGYKVTDVESIEEGSHFKVGGKECEIQGPITAEDYLSGRCFSEGFVPDDKSTGAAAPSYTSPLLADRPKDMVKPIPVFRNPHVGGEASGASRKSFHRPTTPLITPNSLVMPRPSHTHQWAHNKKQLPVVDVVVDASLARCLRPHQQQGLVFLYECIMEMRPFDGGGAILADEMGLGKTLQCITLVWTLLRQGPYGGYPVLRRIIIITPSSLVKNWVKEFKKWLPNSNLRIYYVDQKNKVEGFLRQPSLYPVLILSYEMYLRVSDSLANINFDLLICDEAHRLKNANIKIAGSLQNLGITRKILVTGTPVQNDLQEFFTLIDFCNPGILGQPSSFRRVYEEPILQSRLPQATQEQKELGQARADELSRITALFVLRRTQDVIQSYLPGKAECVVFCRPTSLQLTVYRELLASNAVQACLSSYLSCDANHHLACILALRKLCNHPSLLAPRHSPSSDKEQVDLLPTKSQKQFSLDMSKLAAESLEASSGKLKVLAAMLASLWDSSPREKIVVVSNFTRMLNVVQELCACKGYTFVRLDGSTSSTQRLEIVERFNSAHSDCFVFLLSCKAGGVGLNLIGASRIVLYDVDWNPANDLQAMARVWRDGQGRHVYVYRLVTTGTVEEKIYQRQVMKLDLSRTVLEKKQDGKKAKFSLEDLKDLFTLEEGTVSSTHRLLGCPCDHENNPEMDVSVDPFPSENADTDVAAEAVSAKSQRNCQLGTPPASSSILGKKLGVGNLLKWEHIPAPIGCRFIQDPHLAAAEEDITFVFRNTTSKS
ncbi:DNA repair and recombination protein RAD54B isoform X2 [Ixodes scapularis]|uniref:DNA repair and recombination protein RAD54B isoform X2 n=1 Tax=Ixodes scapularis TaxID=6945 RepID=UPI001C385A50|nr:DNA repair and recombination protein RAD54B isoform X2 [Ixodes scapularis]